MTRDDKVDLEREMDDVVLNRREKQISLGKGTEHYRKYTELVEIADRNNNTPGTAGGPGGRDRTLAVKSRKNVRKITFFS